MKIDTATKRRFADPADNYAYRRAWVIYHLKLKGETLAGLARKAGVNRRQTQKALSRPYPRMEAIIADTLGVKVQDLFPDRYPDGARPGASEPRGVGTSKNNRIPRHRKSAVEIRTAIKRR